LIDRLLGSLLGRRVDADVAADVDADAVPPGVVLRRGRWITAVGGLLAGMEAPAAAVTIGRTIVLHPRVRLSDALLRHELEHVRQWQERPLAFPLLYVINHVRFGYRDNPYEVAARHAEADDAPSEERT
jgi:hypothetical protein